MYGWCIEFVSNDFTAYKNQVVKKYITQSLTTSVCYALKQNNQLNSDFMKIKMQTQNSNDETIAYY